MTKIPTDTIETAIRESALRGQIVTIESDSLLADALAGRADDSVEMSYDRGPDAAPGRLVEYWGTDEDGDAWRVHVMVVR